MSDLYNIQHIIKTTNPKYFLIRNNISGSICSKYVCATPSTYWVNNWYLYFQCLRWLGFEEILSDDWVIAGAKTILIPGILVNYK
jgi:hypothetical protein